MTFRFADLYIYIHIGVHCSGEKNTIFRGKRFLLNKRARANTGR